jgi:hypothetical protein
MRIQKMSFKYLFLTVGFALVVALSAMPANVFAEGPVGGYLAEEDVSIESLQEIFQGAFFETEIDSDGDLVVKDDGKHCFVKVMEAIGSCFSDFTILKKNHP